MILGKAVLSLSHLKSTEDFENEISYWKKKIYLACQDSGYAKMNLSLLIYENKNFISYRTPGNQND